MNKIVIFQNFIFCFFEKDPILAKNTMHIKEVFMRHVALSLSVSQSGVLNILYASLFDCGDENAVMPMYLHLLYSPANANVFAKGISGESDRLSRYSRGK